MFDRIADGRTDLVFEYIRAGNPAAAVDADCTRLIQWCAYYGDVSAVKFLLSQGESLQYLGPVFGLNAAAVRPKSGPRECSDWPCESSNINALT